MLINNIHSAQRYGKYPISVDFAENTLHLSFHWWVTLFIHSHSQQVNLSSLLNNKLERIRNWVTMT